MMESSKWLSALEEFVTRREAEGKAGKEEWDSELMEG